MKINMLRTLSFLMFFSFIAKGQVDSLNTASDELNPSTIRAQNHSYLVYLQDSIDGPKYRIEIWDRKLSYKHDSREYILSWSRFNSEKGKYSRYNILTSARLVPKTEHIHKYQSGEAPQGEESFSFHYRGDSLLKRSTSTGDEELVLIWEDLESYFNWEMDLEILAALNWESTKSVALAFYHPGSTTPPAYYTYTRVGKDTLDFRAEIIECWLIEHRLNQHQKTQFWISSNSNLVLQVKDEFFGMIRYKKLVL